jgi:hypothetical protein
VKDERHSKSHNDEANDLGQSSSETLVFLEEDGLPKLLRETSDYPRCKQQKTMANISAYQEACRHEGDAGYQAACQYDRQTRINQRPTLFASKKRDVSYQRLGHYGALETQHELICREANEDDPKSLWTEETSRHDRQAEIRCRGKPLRHESPSEAAPRASPVHRLLVDFSHVLGVPNRVQSSEPAIEIGPKKIRTNLDRPERTPRPTGDVSARHL